jgi:hypothetical protein
MRLTLLCAAVLAVLSISASASAQQPDQPQQPPVNQDKIKDPAAADQATKPQPPPPPVPASQIATGGPAGDSLAAAARKAREQKKDQAAARVFDNDNIPKQGGVSSVGASSDASATDASGQPAANATGATAASATPGSNDEKGWRELFAKLRKKLEQDQDHVDVSQRELGVLDVQYYNDPNKAMEQNLTRSDINEKTAKVEAAKQQVEADKQAISDAEDELRKAGGDIGWSR